MRQPMVSDHRQALSMAIKDFCSVLTQNPLRYFLGTFSIKVTVGK